VLILSRKPGESIVLETPSFSAKAEPGPMPPVPGGDGPSGGGDTSPAPCAALAVSPGRLAGWAGRVGSDRGRDRPLPECESRELDMSVQ
jgi:hypothetical protein